MKFFLIGWLAWTGLSAGFLPGTRAEETPPNILFILADDLAWADLACYGHPWHNTPHLDALAGEGMRFTQAYAPAPICSASRAAILTGKTPARLNFEFVTKDQPGYQAIDADLPLRAPPFTLNLPLKESTIPEVLTQAGYQTAFFGKWHVSQHHQRYLGWSPTHGPKQQGFDIAVEDFGSHPYSYRKQGKPDPVTESGVIPRDSMTDQAIDYIRGAHDQPFFLMASHFYVHTPVQTPCQWLIEKFEALVPADSPNRDKRVTYAAFVETLDHHVGQLIDALDEAGLRDDTLVVFTSDNGGHPEFAANGPLRGSKWNLYEGGIRVPFIVRWPDHIAAGASNPIPVIACDLLPTFAELAGADLSAIADAIDGRSLVPLFDNPEEWPSRELVWHFPYYHPEKKAFAASQDSIGVDDFAVSKTRPHSAIRFGRHKLLHFYEDDHVELYDVASDPGEQRDLSSTHPSVTQGLQLLLDAYLLGADARLPEKVQ